MSDNVPCILKKRLAGKKRDDEDALILKALLYVDATDESLERIALNDPQESV